jgi:hypothetical protein
MYLKLNSYQQKCILNKDKISEVFVKQNKTLFTICFQYSENSPTPKHLETTDFEQKTNNTNVNSSVGDILPVVISVPSYILLSYDCTNLEVFLQGQQMQIYSNGTPYTK